MTAEKLQGIHSLQWIHLIKQSIIPFEYIHIITGYKDQVIRFYNIYVQQFFNLLSLILRTQLLWKRALTTVALIPIERTDEVETKTQEEYKNTTTAKNTTTDVQ